MDRFWTEDISVLFRDNNYLNFIPTVNMTRIEQLNAITRFCVYLIILIIVSGRDEKYLYLPVMIIILSVVLYYVYRGSEKYSTKTNANNTSGILVGTLDMDNNIDYRPAVHVSDSDALNAELCYERDGCNARNSLFRNQYGDNIVDYPFNELTEYKKQAGKKPTEDNPFTNPPVTSFNTPDADSERVYAPEAMNADDEDIVETQANLFDADLYRDLQDIWDVKNSRRIWYTVQPQVPADQPNFARWLYGNMDTCKTNQQMCLRYEDLRFKR